LTNRREWRLGVFNGLLQEMNPSACRERSLESIFQKAAKTESLELNVLRSFEIVPLETVSETYSNAGIGDLNGDGWPDLVVARSGAPCFVMFNRPYKE
jgi:hypothetical protein